MSENTYQGSCFCGAIKLTVSGAPVAMGYCHCESCRHWSAGPVNAFSLWDPQAVVVTQGADKLGSYAKTDNSHRKWCTACGGHVFTDRLLNLRGREETLLLGAATMRDIIEKLLPGVNIVTRPRMSMLTYAGSKKITRLPRRSAALAPRRRYSIVVPPSRLGYGRPISDGRNVASSGKPITSPATKNCISTMGTTER